MRSVTPASLFKVLLFSLMLLAVASSSSLAQEMSAPEKLGVDLEGKPFLLGEHLGKENLYLVFWTTWCGVCQTEIPNLIQTYEKVKAVHLVAVNPGINDSLERTKRYQKKFKLPYPIVFDASGISGEVFSIYGVPTVVLINKKKEIVYQGFPLPAQDLADLLTENPELSFES